jgi:threonylcarbamoyladenosine tRNA methylthiotransferase MtaB
MNRKYNADEYKEGCRRLREVFDHPAITTDVIVGFPQETEEEFAESKAFCKDINFYEMHVFKYSKRHGTKAEKMPGQIPEKEKALRSDALLTLEEEMSKEYRSYFVGKEVSVLFEEEISVDGKRYMTGFTKEYIKVAYPIKDSGEKLANEIRNGRITGFLKNDLMLFEI